MTQRQGLLKDEACLGHGAFGSIDQQQNAVDHLKDTLYLAAEIGVARRINDVDLDALIVHRCVFGQDRDAALTFKVVAVHDPLGHSLVLSEGAALLEHLVDQRRLAVVDVGDDGDVSQIFS